ncbi:MAG: hypothetical protein KA105_03575 [Caulobacter sp.]|nr:hypothetical protein [Caulobacter sp.]
MIVPLLTALFLFAPMDLAGDQATLTALVAEGLDKSLFSDPANAPEWSGEGCVSRMRTPQVGPFADMEIDWSRVTVGEMQAERFFQVAGVVYPNDPGDDSALLMPFKDPADAEAARAAMLRLKIACTPQR